MAKRKSRRARVNKVLGILLKEVLEQIPANEAEKLVEGYSNDKNIVLIIGQSSFGPDKQTAFAWSLTKDQKWRRLPDTVPGIH